MIAELADVVVDAIFGTGFTGAAKGTAAAAIELINDAPGVVVSVDIASGVGASNGVRPRPRRDRRPHRGAARRQGRPLRHAGRHLQRRGRGGAHRHPAAGRPRRRRVAAHGRQGVEPLLLPKGRLDHKRSVGTVLVVGGSRGMTGAAHMTAMAALRSGRRAGARRPAAGRGRREALPRGDRRRGARQRTGSSRWPGRRRCSTRPRGCKAVAVGPGLGRGDEAQLAGARAHRRSTGRCCWTPTALYALGDRPELLAERTEPTVLTPHEGELGRLLGRPAEEVAAQRLECVRSAAQRSNATVLLKGEATIVADPSGRAYVVPTGNPGLATPGTGDVLSGVIVAQLAKGLSGHRRGLPRRLPARPGRRPRRRADRRHRRHDRQRPVPVPAGRHRAAQDRRPGGRSA